MNRQLRKTIKKCLKNDRQAQFDLYHLCFDHLMCTCLRYKRNREDAVALLNDGFLKVLLNLKQYDFNREFFPWISTIMLRTAIDDYRAQRNYKNATDFKETDRELEEVSLGERHTKIIDNLSWEELQKMIFSLPEMERVVFNLFEWDGYHHSEIAEKMGFSERTSKRYLKEAKRKLRQWIEKQNDLKKVI